MKTENDLLQKDFPSFTKVKEYIECAEKTMFSRYNVCSYLDIVNKSYKDRIAASGVIYDILMNWGMKRAKPFDREDFIEMMEKADISELLDTLKDFNLNDFNGNNAKDIIKNLKLLFDEITLTHCSTKLVFFSKAMHLYLPELFIPMDWKYTIAYLEENSLQNKKDKGKELNACIAYHKLMANLYKDYEVGFNELQAKTCSEKKWPITKLLDHAVIGFESQKKSGCMNCSKLAIKK